MWECSIAALLLKDAWWCHENTGWGFGLLGLSAVPSQKLDAGALWNVHSGTCSSVWTPSSAILLRLSDLWAELRLWLLQSPPLEIAPTWLLFRFLCSNLLLAPPWPFLPKKNLYTSKVSQDSETTLVLSNIGANRFLSCKITDCYLFLFADRSFQVRFFQL